MEKTEMKWGRQNHVKKSGGQNSLDTPLDLYQLLCFRSKNINKGGKNPTSYKGFGLIWPSLSLYKVISHGINL